MSDIHITEGPRRGEFTDEEKRRRWTWLTLAVVSALRNPRSPVLREAVAEIGPPEGSSDEGFILDLQTTTIEPARLAEAMAELRDWGAWVEEITMVSLSPTETRSIGLLVTLNPDLSREDHIAVARLQLNALAGTAGT